MLAAELKLSYYLKMYSIYFTENENNCTLKSQKCIVIIKCFTSFMPVTKLYKATDYYILHFQLLFNTST